MQAKIHYALLILAGMMTLSLSAARVPAQPQPALSQPASGEPVSDSSIPLQSGSCMAILQAAGQQAGVEGDTSLNSFEGLNGFGMISCGLSYREQIGYNRQALGTGLGLNDVGDRYETFSHGECRNSDELPNDSSYLFNFHGYLAIMETYVSEKTRTHDTDDIVHMESKSIFWYMDGGGDYCYSLSVRTTTDSVEEFGHAQDPTPIADVLWSIAEANLPLTPPAADGTDQQDGPVLPGENADPQTGDISPEEENPLQPETPSDTDTTDPGNSIFDIPLAIVLGSFGIPIAGAAAGALVSAVLGTLTPGAATTAGTSSGPAAVKKKGDPVSSDPASEELPESPPPEKDVPPTDPPDPAAEEKPVEETPEEETDPGKEPEPEEQPPAAKNTETKETSTEPEKPKPEKKAVTPEQ
ncbi:MAG: hypothetical protein JXA25_15190, partial [Anaerolineales bacterium]|nr:hypothetical protein [Anaerolineales bacterium]